MTDICRIMRGLIIILLMALAAACQGQITIDTASGGIVTVKEKTTTGVKTTTIYRLAVEGTKETYNLIVYQPTAAEAGDEPPPNPPIYFAKEATHLKAMLDEALKKKKFNFSRISFNILPCSDMIAKLVEVYSSSKEWNDYLKKNTDLVKYAIQVGLIPAGDG